MAKKSVDDFLAAPEEVVKNPRERKKLLDRKARDEARKRRERALKRKVPPSLEDVLADVVRVAEDEATNPWHEFRAVSMRRYELYGYYTVEQALKYGRFEHLKQMAGLAQSPGDRMVLAARTDASLKAHDERYVKRYLAPYADLYPELKRATQKSRLVASISDTHSLFMDPFTWLAFLAFVEDAQPEVVVWGGDHVDGSEISAHSKVPGHTTPLQVELDALVAMWREARERCPKARFVWLESNHFMARLVRYLSQVAPELSGMRTLRIDQLLDLEGLGVEVVQPGTFLSPKGQEDARPRARLFDRCTATHGSKVGKYPAMAELLEWGDSGFSGHVHRHQVVMGSASGLRECQWMCLPGGTIDQVAKYYVRGNHPAWSRGFGVTEFAGRRALQHTPVVCSEGVAMANGWYYEARGKLPEGVAAVRKFWMKRWKLPWD